MTTRTESIFRSALFGALVSIKREREIAALLRRIALFNDANTKAELDTFAATLDDITITWNSGNGIITIVYPDGTMELPHQLYAGVSVTFDAPAKVIVKSITPADSTGALFTTDIAPEYKGVLDATRLEERETIIDNAEDTYITTIEKFDEFDEKITGDACLEFDVRAA